MVLIRIDDTGEWPVLVDDEQLPTGDGARWRFVAEVEGVAQGRLLLALLHRRREEAPERRWAELSEQADT